MIGLEAVEGSARGNDCVWKIFADVSRERRSGQEASELRWSGLLRIVNDGYWKETATS